MALLRMPNTPQALGLLPLIKFGDEFRLWHGLGFEFWMKLAAQEPWMIL